MTRFGIYAVFGVPAILLAMAYAAVKLAERDTRRFDEAQARARQPGEQGGPERRAALPR